MHELTDVSSIASHCVHGHERMLNLLGADGTICGPPFISRFIYWIAIRQSRSEITLSRFQCLNLLTLANSSSISQGSQPPVCRGRRANVIVGSSVPRRTGVFGVALPLKPLCCLARRGCSQRHSRQKAPTVCAPFDKYTCAGELELILFFRAPRRTVNIGLAWQPSRTTALNG